MKILQMEVVKISTNVPETPITVIRMLHVEISLEVSAVLVTMVMKVMVSHVMILMNVQEKLTTVMSLRHVPILSAHTTAHVMMDIWVMDFCALFHVLHSTILARMVS